MYSVTPSVSLNCKIFLLWLNLSSKTRNIGGLKKHISVIFFKGALDNIIFKISFWLNFIYHVKSDCEFTNTARKIQKFLLKVKKSSIFVKHV